MAGYVNQRKPIPGCWYLRLDTHERFEVVAVDRQSDVIEIQYFDGDLGEIELEEWRDLPVREIEQSEDWTGPMEELEEGDFGYDDDEFDRGPVTPRKPISATPSESSRRKGRK
ncbi:MAG: hypothetical protein PVJ40_09170 [Gammaproteobacteria bacterium]|jgi:hypothetical protein